MKPDGKKQSVLVIDDDQIIRDVIVEYLGQIGFSTLEAVDGDSGIKLFDEHSPDVVLLDIQMPGTDGFEVLKAIRFRTDETPVIIISGVGTQKDTTKALRLGAWDYITKPFQELDILEHAVEKALERAALKAANKELKKQLPVEKKKSTFGIEHRIMELERAYNVLEREIQERKRAERAIESERSYLQNVIDGIKTPAMIVNSDKKVMMMNSGLLALLPSNYVGKQNLTCHQAYRQSEVPCGGEDHPCVLEEILKPGKPAICRSARFMTCTGSTLPAIPT